MAASIPNRKPAIEHPALRASSHEPWCVERSRHASAPATSNQALRSVESQANRDNLEFDWRRSSPYHLAGNRNAVHPVNAILVGMRRLKANSD
jgi:hypothetical protein